MTIDPTPFQGIGDRDLESRDASSPDSRNAKSRKERYEQVLGHGHGHIMKGASAEKIHLGASPIAMWSDENLHLRNNEMRDHEKIRTV